MLTEGNRAMPNPSATKTVLIIGASRGLGYAMAEEYLKHGWSVVGTVRGESRTKLHDLAAKHDTRVQVETLDINVPDQIAALRTRLAARTFDLLFVNSGTTNNDPDETVAEVRARDGDKRPEPDARRRSAAGSCSTDGHDRRDVVRPGKRREQHQRDARGVPWQ